jgi:hypothetical protein
VIARPAGGTRPCRRIGTRQPKEDDMRVATWKRASAALTLALLTACEGSTDPTAPAPTTESTALAGEDATAICTSVITRQRECSGTFVPALVDLRIRLDRPAGIAARGSGDGRAALVAAALDEWRADSTDQAIAATCSAVRGSAKSRSIDHHLVRAEDCLAQDSCDAFVSCLEPVLESFLR